MTLVVARLNNGSLTVTADTQVTPSIDRKSDQERATHARNSIPGNLKVFVVSPELCFAYAGNPHYAHEALREVLKERKCSKNKVIKTLEHWHRKSHAKGDSSSSDDFQTDFLLVSAKSEFFKISDGRSHMIKDDTCWIGSEDAFLEYMKTGCNFTAVIENSNFRNVGGLDIVVKLSKFNKFIYEGSIFHAAVQLNVTSENTKVDQLSGGQGEVSYQIMPPKAFRPVLGLYLSEPLNVGYLYHPASNDIPVQVSSINFTDFVQRCEDIAEVELAGVELKDISVASSSSPKSIEISVDWRALGAPPNNQTSVLRDENGSVISVCKKP